MLARLRHLVGAILRRDELEREMDEEMRLHLELRAEDLARSGLDPAEAARRARLEFGSVPAYQEACREAQGLGLLDEARGDALFALRAFRRSPAFTVTAVLTLALGIGALTAIFSAVKSVLLSQLPYRDAGRLVALGQSDRGEPRPGTIGYATAVDWRLSSRSFTSLSLYRDASAALVSGGSTELLSGLRVNHDFLETLGVTVSLGRSFLPEEDRPASRFEVILAHTLWVRSFGADPAVLGRSIRLNERSFRVVGVLPASFRSWRSPAPQGRPSSSCPSATRSPIRSRAGAASTSASSGA